MATPKSAPYKVIQRQPPFNMRSVLEIVQHGKKLYAFVGSSIRRAFPKVRGKANVKAAKRQRIAARQIAA